MSLPSLIPRGVFTKRAMTKPKQPEVVMIPQGTSPELVRSWAEQSHLTLGSEPKPGLVTVYPDRRILPQVCQRTGIRREFCCCAPCRGLRRRKHGASCRCWLCYSDRMGGFIDRLGRRTAAGRWLWFLTLTYRTQHFPWAKGFPIEQPGPCADFAHHFFARMILWIERQVHSRVEYFVADQFGETGRRLHSHCGLSWPGLFEYRWKDLQEMLWQEAGFNRILPWEMDAGYYIGRYIGRDAERCHWDFSVGYETVPLPVQIGRRIVVESLAPDDSTREFRKTCRRRHR